MVLPDVNLLLHAARPDSPHHRRCRGLLDDLARGDEPLALCDLVLASVVRIATNPRVFDPPASPASVFAFCAALRRHPRATPIAPGPRHWQIFEDLVVSTGIRGADTTDAWFAALAIEHGCEWWTADLGFTRFPGLRWRNPLDEPVAS